MIFPSGTMWNFTFGFEWCGLADLREDQPLLGATYHHISNALGHEKRSQP
jgi:hypothetical protein